ncbi:MAG: DUF2177 family protein [Ramlibacter sp.]
MSRTALTYLAVAVTLFVLDMVWLLWIARDWYQQGIGHLMAARCRRQTRHQLALRAEQFGLID